MSTLLLGLAVVVFALVASAVVGPTIEGIQAVPLGLTLFAASFFPFGLISTVHIDRT